MRIDLGYTPPQKDIFFPPEEKRFNVFPCGRRFGKTQGAAHACIEWALEGMPILWGDTINANIAKYVERYFKPPLKDSDVKWRWREEKNILEIGGGYIDFRSSDNPATWEGFGYRKIILNEAGVILGDAQGNKGPYLYSNAVLPMMIDFGHSQLYAIGVPKGKELRSGDKHPFYRLWEKVGVDPAYRGRQYKSWDNPLLDPKDVDELYAEIAAMAPGEEQQEIDAEFRDGVAGTLFAHKFDIEKHRKECKQIPTQPVYISIDFNVEPFCAIFAHIWEDQHGPHCWIFREESIMDPTVSEMVARIRAIVPHHLLIQMTGDRGGSARRLGEKSTASLFDDLTRLLNLNSRQLELPANPPHLKSREDTNYVLVHHPDFRIDPSCKGLIRDNLSVCVEKDGSIIKKDRKQASQQADLIDGERYLINTYLRRWLTDHRRGLR